MVQIVNLILHLALISSNFLDKIKHYKYINVIFLVDCSQIMNNFAIKSSFK
jgi:hypothetical protein